MKKGILEISLIGSTKHLSVLAEILGQIDPAHSKVIECEPTDDVLREAGLLEVAGKAVEVIYMLTATGATLAALICKLARLIKDKRRKWRRRSGIPVLVARLEGREIYRESARKVDMRLVLVSLDNSWLIPRTEREFESLVDSLISLGGPTARRAIETCLADQDIPIRQRSIMVLEVFRAAVRP